MTSKPFFFLAEDLKNNNKEAGLAVLDEVKTCSTAPQTETVVQSCEEHSRRIEELETAVKAGKESLAREEERAAQLEVGYIVNGKKMRNIL